jgi:hypothetical protein
MNTLHESDWNKLAHFLQQNHLLTPILFLLETALPLKLVLSQSIYLSEPYIRNNAWSEFARILEDPNKSTEFVNFLLSEEWHE